MTQASPTKLPIKCLPSHLSMAENQQSDNTGARSRSSQTTVLIFQPEIGLIQEPKQVRFDQTRPFNFPWYSEYLYNIVTISYYSLQ